MDIIIASFIEEVIVPKFNYWIYVILMMIGLFAMITKNNLIKNLKFPVKVLGDGDVKRNITVKANMFSQSAIKKIEDAGGEVIIL